MLLKSLLISAIISIFLLACSDNQKPSDENYSQKTQIGFEIFKTEGGFGYDVLIDGKVYIHQPQIPAIQGLKPFSSSEDAQKTANLVIEKIKYGNFPPKLTIAELDSLGVIPTK